MKKYWLFLAIGVVVEVVDLTEVARAIAVLHLVVHCSFVHCGNQPTCHESLPFRFKIGEIVDCYGMRESFVRWWTHPIVVESMCLCRWHCKQWGFASNIFLFQSVLAEEKSPNMITAAIMENNWHSGVG